jgi:hypothetical protein
LVFGKGLTVADEISSILEEINEELKNDQLLMFFKKHKNAVLGVLSVSVVGILIYSSWHTRKTKQLEEITNTLLDELRQDHKDSGIIGSLLANAPTELIPILTIIESGRKLSLSGDASDVSKNAEALLSLTKKHGVDVVWKDLAMIVYASHKLKSSEDLMELLRPLTTEGRPFRFMAMEILAVNCKNLGDHEKAREYLGKIIESHVAPSTLKKRALILLNHIKNSSEKE